MRNGETSTSASSAGAGAAGATAVPGRWVTPPSAWLVTTDGSPIWSDDQYSADLGRSSAPPAAYIYPPGPTSAAPSYWSQPEVVEESRYGLALLITGLLFSALLVVAAVAYFGLHVGH